MSPIKPVFSAALKLGAHPKVQFRVCAKDSANLCPMLLRVCGLLVSWTSLVAHVPLSDFLLIAGSFLMLIAWNTSVTEWLTYRPARAAAGSEASA